MKILHLTPELAPWSKAGGLGDAAAALAKQLAALGHEVRVATPLYGSMPGREQMGIKVESLRVPVGGDPARAACRVRSLALAPRCEAWFIEHEDFYGAREIYPPREDTAERAVFFGRAGLEACLATGWIPDVVHCHDWTTGLVPALLNTTLKASALGGAASVLTIHNLQHQGVLNRRVLDYLGLPAWLFQPHELECLGGVNFLKGGILHATRVATVSPTYAREILTAEYGYGLDDVVRRRQRDLEGILNGVDTDDWDPRRDPHLAQAYSAQDPTGKAACKAALQRELRLAEMPGVPLVGVISRLWDQKGLDLAVRALPRFLDAGQLQFALLGSGDAALEDEYRQLAAAFPGRCAVSIGYDNALSHRIEAGADFFLMPSRFEPCGLNQLYSMAYGTLPIVRATGGLADTVKPWSPSARQGTGIVFHHADVGAIAWALEQALALYAQPADFATAQNQAMREEFSWGKAAQAYVACYQKAVRMKQS
jgi:starch synthase